MYVVTLKVAKDCNTITSGLKFVRMANVGDIGVSNKSKNGGGGGGGGGGSGGGGDSQTNHHHPRR